MLFNSFQFAIFFPVAVLLYYLTPQGKRWLTTLLLSYYFYMCWKPVFLALILISTTVDWLVGLGLDRTQDKWKRRGLLLTTIIINIGILSTFKYSDFLFRNIEEFIQYCGLSWNLPSPVMVLDNLFSGTREAFIQWGFAAVDAKNALAEPRFILPVGISFFTFQSLSYSLDVFMGKTKAERHFGKYATFVAFFPQLVAGPIERSDHLLGQLTGRPNFTWNRCADGLRLMMWGLFKKICVADLISVPVDTIYGDPARYNGPLLLFGTLLFAMQIYCDFSGYSDIAIGAAKIMGIDIMTNFRQPYLSRSVAEFWTRWHISLSTWFRDYLYIPLGGSRVNISRWIVNIYIVFLVSAVWHKSVWTMLIWGLLHATYLVGERLLGPAMGRGVRAIGLGRLPRVLTLLKVALTFSLVLVAWVFFRANTITDAWAFLRRMVDWRGAEMGDLMALNLGLPTFETMLCVLMPIVLFTIDYFISEKPAWVMRLWGRSPVRTLLYVACLTAIMMFGVFGKVDFIYFQF